MPFWERVGRVTLVVVVIVVLLVLVHELAGARAWGTRGSIVDFYGAVYDQAL